MSETDLFEVILGKLIGTLANVPKWEGCCTNEVTGLSISVPVDTIQWVDEVATFLFSRCKSKDKSLIAFEYGDQTIKFKTLTDFYKKLGFKIKEPEGEPLKIDLDSDAFTPATSKDE
jgi:hypothetical protein